MKFPSTMMCNIVIVFGNDHTNTVGVTQSLGRVGYSVINVLFGTSTGYVKSSSFSKYIINGRDEQECVEKILLSNIASQNNSVPIVCCCDKAALSINQRYDEIIQAGYLVEHTNGILSFNRYFEKNIQVKLALNANFYVPKSFVIDSLNDIPADVTYPCLIKPLTSCMGAKSDIRICHTLEELQSQYLSLQYTKRVILQQYIDRDFEISVLGCGLSNGECLIPAVENKLTLYPKLVGLECLAQVVPLNDNSIIESIKSLVHTIGYVGLFSVEMMHNKADGKFYFTEINLRNDGAQSFIFKYGVNLPEVHVRDLLGLPQKKYDRLHPGYYVWDFHHFMSWRNHDISTYTWLKQIVKSKGMLMFTSHDMKPFFKQYEDYNPVRFIWNKYVKKGR